ncbi:hypothetical protein C4D60_Mb11t16100 [Musa balbisiana]|uniref:PDZ domain-containing protein n=1 Tax=Musa balbisiana TaxID=52838 RepID=A0A4S8J4F5_MUSBA|nr:hypothetical protein C4D60_Mb11t16100 [Musa balbisiana]
MAAVNVVFASPSCSSPLSFPRSSSSYRRSIFASHRPHRSGRQSLSKDHSNRRKNDVVEGVSQKRFPGRGKDDRTYLPSDGSRGDAGLSQSESTVFKSIGTQKKDKGVADETGKFQDSAFLNAVVKVKVKRRGDDTKFVAKVLARGIECDIALLSVESEDFWKGAEPLRFGHLPCLQDSVTVVGYPLGGDTISVTKGVVSRIEVTSYAHGSSDLLGIQIDAAINPGNSGGPAFNDHGECIGVAFQVFRSEEAENIGYVIPTTVVSHFLNDYERSGKYTGFPSLGVLLQKLENPALRACLKVSSNEGVLVRRVEPTSPANDVLKEGDVIVSFDGVQVGSEGTVPFRSTERIAFRYLISQKFSGDVAELGIIRDGTYMKVRTVLQTRVHLVPFHIEGGQPSYLIIAGLVFTPLSEPLIEEECEDSIGLKLLAKARYSLARFKGEEIVILSQVLANEVNIGYEDMGNQQVMKFNGTPIKNIRHLAHLEDKQILNQDIGDSPVSNFEIGFDGLLWA